MLPSHSTVGTLRNRRDGSRERRTAASWWSGWWRTRDPVAPGQPLLRLHPTVESADAIEVSR